MKRSPKATLWIGIYLLLVFTPLLLLFIGPRPAGREFWRELSVALGFAGMALMGLQFIPTARLPFLANVFPLDTLYTFHHQTSVVGFLLAMAHPIILFINNPYTLQLLDIFNAPLRARAAVFATVAVILLILTSVWRKALEIKYESWRAIHDLLAVLIAVMALYHMFNVNYHMSNPLQRGFWGLMAVIWAGMMLYIRVIKPWIMLQHPYELKEVIEERGSSWTLTLAPVGHKGLTFMPGQVAWLTVQRSPFSIRQHPFSFSSSAEHPEQLQFTIRELGDFTATVKDLPIGERVYIDGPYGTFDIDQHAAPGYVFLAGGIGSAPIMSMLRTLADRGDTRPLYFFYGSQTWESVIYREELESLEEELDLRLVHVLQRPPEEWTGETGFITTEVLARHLPEDRVAFVYFICGPLPMIAAVERSLEKLHIPISHVHSEQYDMA